jgi:hypothetical protein
VALAPRPRVVATWRPRPHVAAALATGGQATLFVL